MGKHQSQEEREGAHGQEGVGEAGGAHLGWAALRCLARGPGVMQAVLLAPRVRA